MRPAEPIERAAEPFVAPTGPIVLARSGDPTFPDYFENSRPILQTALCAQVGGGAFGSGPSHSPHVGRTWILQRGRGLGLGSCAGYARRNSSRPASRLMGWCGRHGVRAGGNYSIFGGSLVVANEELPLSTDRGRSNALTCRPPTPCRRLLSGASPAQAAIQTAPETMANIGIEGLFKNQQRITWPVSSQTAFKGGAIGR
jgi:hypothetical protein